MAAHEQELEVKFFVRDLAPFEKQLKNSGAVLVQPRTHEINLRFDTANQMLTSSLQVLRLRQDTETRLTYKGPGELLDGVRLRREIEFSVSDFQSAQLFLEALGYQVIFMYEKFRSVYNFNELLVMLDEMPTGYFLELEGPSPEIIFSTSQILGLKWETRILESYTVLFDRVRQSCGLKFRDLSFANFEGLQVTPEQMHLEYAEGDK